MYRSNSPHLAVAALLLLSLLSILPTPLLMPPSVFAQEQNKPDQSKKSSSLTNSNKMGFDDFLGKKYKLTSSENFDELMKALGVGLITRKMGAAVSPSVEVTKSGDEYTMSTKSTFKNSEVKFKLGEEFDEETPDGRKVKSTITIDGNTMTHIQKGDKTTTIKREYSETEMKAIMTVDDVVCTRIYKLEN